MSGRYRGLQRTWEGKLKERYDLVTATVTRGVRVCQCDRDYSLVGIVCEE